MWWWCSFSAAESSVELLSEVDHLAKQVSEGNITLDQALSSDSIWALKTASTEWRQSLQQHRTAQLWLMYMTLVSILRTFIRAG